MQLTKLDHSLFLPHFPKLGVVRDSVFENHPTARYVGQFPLRTSGDYPSFTDWAADFYYVPDPDVSKGHSNYFAVYVRDEKVYITNGKHVEKLVCTVCIMHDGSYLYPRFQHDFRSVGDFFVDGGSWVQSNDFPGYVTMWGRRGGDNIPQSFSMTIKDGEFYRIEI